MGASNKACPNCGRKMKQQFPGLQHCRCGMSWKRDIGYFERTPDMVFALERRTVGKKVKQVPVIRTGASSDTELFKNHRSTIRFQGHRIATCLYRTPMGSRV